MTPWDREHDDGSNGTGIIAFYGGRGEIERFSWKGIDSCRFSALFLNSGKILTGKIDVKNENEFGLSELSRKCCKSKKNIIPSKNAKRMVDVFWRGSELELGIIFFKIWKWGVFSGSPLKMFRASRKWL